MLAILSFLNNVPYASGAGRGRQEQVSRKGAMRFPAVFLSDPRRSHGTIRTCQHVSRRKRSKRSKSTWEIRGRLLSERGKGEGSPNWPRRRGCFLIGRTRRFLVDFLCIKRNLLQRSCGRMYFCVHRRYESISHHVDWFESGIDKL